MNETTPSRILGEKEYADALIRLRDTKDRITYNELRHHHTSVCYELHTLQQALATAQREQEAMQEALKVCIDRLGNQGDIKEITRQLNQFAIEKARQALAPKN